MEAPLSLWTIGFSLNNFHSRSLLFDPNASTFVIDDVSKAQRVYSATQIHHQVQSDIASLLSSVEIPSACQAEIEYRR